MPEVFGIAEWLRSGFLVQAGQLASLQLVGSTWVETKTHLQELCGYCMWRKSEEGSLQSEAHKLRRAYLTPVSKKLREQKL